MNDPDPQTRLLRLCACLELSTPQRVELKELVQNIDDWRQLLSRAEHHALAPLLYKHLSQADVEYPRQTAMELRALTLRHRRADQIRSAALIELLTALERKHIEALVLKGAALAHIIYPRPELRPMRDVDVLVQPDRADEAQSILREIGFKAPEHHSGYMYEHHHLPGANVEREGLNVSIEIHRDALSGDVDASIRTDRLTGPVQEFDLAGYRARSLGHIDTLRHLTHHTFEPVAEIKLGAVVDLYSYASRFAEDLDWTLLRAQFPFVINALRCLHYIHPLPESLRGQVPPPTTAPPKNVGKGMLPLSQILNARKSYRQQWRQLMYPSDWWMHVFYNVPPERPLFGTRWLRHPVKIMRWLWRRFLASRHSRTQK